MSVLWAMNSPSLIVLPARMAANSSSCSTWYMFSFVAADIAHLFGPSIVCFMSWHEPLVPMTWSDTSFVHFCWRQ